MMADIITSKPAEILEQFQSAFYNQIGRRMQIGSEEFTLSAILTTVLAQYAEAVNVSYRNQNLLTATGEYLDAIGARYNLTRSPETFGNPWFEGEFTFDSECEYYEHATSAGAMHIVIGGHTYRNANAFDDSPEFIVIRFVCDEKHGDALSKAELLRELSALKDSNDKPMFAADSLRSYLVSDLQSVEKTLDDDAFREYIKTNMFRYLPGVAPAFEGIAKASSTNIEDARVRVQGDSGFVPGNVDLFCKPLYMIRDQTLGTLAINYDIPAVADIIAAQHITTIGQTLNVYVAPGTPTTREYSFYAPAQYDSAEYTDLYKLKFASVVGYFNKHVLNMGTSFVPTSILPMMVRDLSEISDNPEDFGWWPEDDGFQKWNQFKALPVIGLQSVNNPAVVTVDASDYIGLNPFANVTITYIQGGAQ